MTNYVSQITIPAGTFDFKDAEARQLIEDLGKPLTYTLSTSKATTPTSAKWQGESGTLVASASTENKVYLVPIGSTQPNAYEEWLTVLVSGNYQWEKIGTTDIDLSSYAQKGDPISVTSGTAALAGTGIGVSDHTVTQGTVSASGNFTPEGHNASSSVSFGTTNLGSASKLSSAGSVVAGSANTPTVINTSKFSGGSYTQGSFNGGSFVQGTDTFTAEVTAGTETLVLNFVQGTDSFTAPTHGSDSFSAAELKSGFYSPGEAGTPTVVSLPEFELVSNLVTKNTPATAAAQEFTGDEGTVSVSGSTAGVSVSSHNVIDNGHTHTITGSGIINQ